MSTRRTERPARASSRATQAPAGPAPTAITSQTRRAASERSKVGATGREAGVGEAPGSTMRRAKIIVII